MRSALDIKAGYFNVPVMPSLMKYLGIVTQDGLYYFQRMVFGHCLAPAHFQSIMNFVIALERWKITSSVFQDDTTIGHRLTCHAWEDTLEAMK